MNTQHNIIKRQWQHRNHNVFGKLARRQIRMAIRILRKNGENA